MTVTILDAWVEVDDYDGNGANFTPSAGSNRVAIIAVGAEENGGGPIGITSMTMGGQSCVKLNDGIVGDSGAYHNYVGLWYLNEAGIAAMSGNTISITWSNFDGVGPFGTSPVVHYASYQDVNQSNINSATNIGSNTSSTTVYPGAIDVALGEKVIGAFVMGQPNTPSVEASMTEETEIIGGSNDMSSSCNHRTATTADASYNPLFTSSSGTRVIATTVALGSAPTTTYEITGITKDNDGVALGSCECFLLKDNGDDTLSFIAHTTSHSSTGAYTFGGLEDNDAQYTVYSYKDETPHVFDVTSRVLEPTEE